VIRALIVDDERLARQRLRRLISKEPDVVVAGECANAHEAIDMIRDRPPDLMFLDVQMPGSNGFDLIKDIGVDTIQVIVFVTAYDQYAIRAFEVHAQDYLLKPFEEARFRQSVQRARDVLSQPRVSLRDPRRHQLLEEIGGRQSQSNSLMIPVGEKILLLKMNDVDFIEAEDNYVRVHAGRQSYLLRETMAALESKLDPGHFARIHRSTIVNLDRVTEFHQLINGEYSVVLHNGKQLRLGRSYRARVQDVRGKSI
jgi:two-component system LytT family response regulator